MVTVMNASRSAERSPHWFGILARTVLLTILGTLTAFVVSLFFGILSTVILASLRRVHPDMRVAYRHIALPIAIVVGVIVFIVTLVMEIRRYRQAKTLSAIERMG
jgi:hypothetical protein